MQFWYVLVAYGAFSCKLLSCSLLTLEDLFPQLFKSSSQTSILKPRTEAALIHINLLKDLKQLPYIATVKNDRTDHVFLVPTV